MRGMNSAISQVMRERRTPAACMENLDRTEIARESIQIYGNSDIGMVANWQALLNHSGLLDTKVMFSISDVVDAVNYKTGDVEPIMKALKNKAVDAVLNGKKLARGGPSNRVFRQLQQEWKFQGFDIPSEVLVKKHISEEKSWIRMLVESLEANAEYLRTKLLYRKLQANGSIAALTKDNVSNNAYAAVIDWDELKNATWSEFLKRRQSAEDQIEDMSFTERRAMGEKFNLESRELSRKINENFVTMLLVESSKRGYIAGEIAVAHIQLETVKESRWLGRRAINFSSLIHLAGSDTRVLPECEYELAALSNMGKPVRTIILPCKDKNTAKHIAEQPDRDWWPTDLIHHTGFSLVIDQLKDQFGTADLPNPGEASKSLRFKGFVGGDTTFAVFGYAEV